MTNVRLTDVTKRFETTTAVDTVSLNINDGEILGVVGPSGCGKTTLLRLLAGFETPTEGQITFDDEPITHVPPENRNVGLVFQSYALFDNMTVLENVTFGPKMHGVNRHQRRERARQMLALLDIENLADRAPQTLSGGQKQRVGLARALAIEPRVLLLDEPMTGLDANLKQTLRVELSELLEDLGVTTVYVTHDQEQAMSMCDRIAVMNSGVIEQVGPPAAVYEQPTNRFVANFVGTSNLLEVAIHDGRLNASFASFELPGLPDRGEVVIAIRPDDIVVGEGDLEGEVQTVFYTGQRLQAVVSLSDGTELTVDVDRRHQLSTGETVSLSIDPTDVHVLR